MGTHRKSFDAFADLFNFPGAFKSEDEGTLGWGIDDPLAYHQVLEVETAVIKNVLEHLGAFLPLNCNAH